MAPGSKQNQEGGQDKILVPMDEWMEAVGERIAFRVARIVIGEHEERCSIHMIKTKVLGTDEKPQIGLDHRVQQLETCKRGIRRAVGIVMQILLPVVSTLLATGIMLWIGWKVIENKAAAGINTNPQAKQKQPAAQESKLEFRP